MNLTNNFMFRLLIVCLALLLMRFNGDDQILKNGQLSNVTCKNSKCQVADLEGQLLWSDDKVVCSWNSSSKVKCGKAIYYNFRRIGSVDINQVYGVYVGETKTNFVDLKGGLEQYLGELKEGAYAFSLSFPASFLSKNIKFTIFIDNNGLVKGTYLFYEFNGKITGSTMYFPVHNQNNYKNATFRIVQGFNSIMQTETLLANNFSLSYLPAASLRLNNCAYANFYPQVYCTACKFGYFLIDGSCNTPFTMYCQKYSGAVCVQCVNGYYLNLTNNQCYQDKPLFKCVKKDNNGNCVRCERNFYVINGKCEPPSKLPQCEVQNQFRNSIGQCQNGKDLNCIRFQTDTGKCAECSKDKVLHAPSGICCPQDTKVPAFKEQYGKISCYDRSQCLSLFCTSCYDGFYPSNGRCVELKSSSPFKTDFKNLLQYCADLAKEILGKLIKSYNFKSKKTAYEFLTLIDPKHYLFDKIKNVYMAVQGTTSRIYLTGPPQNNVAVAINLENGYWTYAKLINGKLNYNIYVEGL